MGTVFVVAPDPLGGHATHLGDGFKNVAVKHLLSVGSVEAFDQAVLHRPSWLYEQPLDPVPARPPLQYVAHEFRTIVQAQRRRLAAAVQIEPERLVDAKQIPLANALRPQCRIQLVKAMARVLAYVRLDRRDEPMSSRARRGS